MARSQITVADVDQAEAALIEAKKRRSKDREGYKAQARETTELRQAFRRQEEAAGRRGGLVGGDARTEG